jgi:FKBP-type peptidyl-prolyl cis-trans isomerase
VIKGWDLALLDMKLGEVRRLVIPSAAGYGAEGAGNGKIPPDATLYYQVEIIYMNKAPQLSAEQLEWMEANPV